MTQRNYYETNRGKPHKDQKLFNFNIIGLVSSPTPNQDVDLIGQDDNNTIRYADIIRTKRQT